MTVSWSGATAARGRFGDHVLYIREGAPFRPLGFTPQGWAPRPARPPTRGSSPAKDTAWVRVGGSALQGCQRGAAPFASGTVSALR